MSSPEPSQGTEKETTGLPWFPAWRGVYVFVVVVFVLFVAFFLLLERAFA